MPLSWTDIDALIEAEVAGERFACRAGCAWCCHQLVVLTNWDDGREILRRARARMSPARYRQFVSEVRRQARAIEALGHAEAEGRRWPCPLLDNDRCTVYEVRPVACRSVFSRNADTCRAMMEHEDFAALTETQQREATEIGERAFRLQVMINDRRRIDGPVELRALLARLLNEDPGSGRESGTED
ncbi:MAG: hypothetical protein D6727_11030 [Gammaproteobacteria bacterium]|nr:MAG: hypothetical protein D6727_11030 [Gammaproteobacteria bacterium]